MEFLQSGNDFLNFAFCTLIFNFLLAPSSRQVQDIGFSTRQQGFESPWGYLIADFRLRIFDFYRLCACM